MQRCWGLEKPGLIALLLKASLLITWDSLPFKSSNGAPKPGLWEQGAIARFVISAPSLD